MLDHKRKSDSNGTLVPIKKPKNELVVSESENNQASVPRRTSNMEAPIMLLSGHEAEIYSAKFHPEGNILASAGFDRQIFLWNVYGDCDNIGVLSGHSGAILELHFNMDGSSLFTASTDKTIGLFNTETGIRVKRMKGHTNFVNSVYPARRGPPLVLSGSDDSTVKIWDSRCRGYVTSIDNVVQVTAVSFNDTAEQILYGGLDNDIKVYDLRKNEILYTLKGHSDTISGLSLSPDGSYLLSNSMDNSLRTWDIRPFANTERCLKVFMGHKHNFEKNLLHCAWSPDGSMVSAGSADRSVYIWDTGSRRILYKLPGHIGTVNDVDFHSVEPIILSASSDKTIYLGEFEDNS